MFFNIPNQITQGDTVTWTEISDNYVSASDTLKCFIRGQAVLDLTGVDGVDRWNFTIDSNQSALLKPGKYQAQFVIVNSTGRQTLGTVPLIVCPSFENLTELETRTKDEIELETITQAIAKLAGGAVAEYWIGDRKMRYQDLEQLTKRQQYLRTRIAIVNGKLKPGGRDVGVRFCD